MRTSTGWVGWGLGDSDPEVRSLRAFMRNKFSYAKGLADIPAYDQAMVDAVVEMQKRYNASGKLATGKYTPGVINFATKVAMGYVAPPPKVDTRPVLFTVCGTGVPWWIGPDAETAKAVESQYLWQPIGYSARAIPMGPSIAEGRAELVNQFNIHRARVLKYGAALAGYSQGAIIVSETWEQDIKPVAGQLNWAKLSIKKAVAWGNPCREKGKVWRDAGAPPSPPDHQGVTDSLMVDTPDWFRNYAHVGDLYADSPDDQSGENRRAAWQLIRDGSITKGPDSLLRQLLELTGAVKDADQISEVTGVFKAMLDAMVFFGKQTGPHVNYSTAEAIAYLRG